MPSLARDPGETPGESEMGWGEGRVPAAALEPLAPEELLHRTKQTNLHSDDPTYVEDVS